MAETWRNISDFERYQVSNYGRVKNLATNHILKPFIASSGYLAVALGSGNKRYVHRLVAQAFIPNPTSLPQVNHRDENKQNNCVDNLEWCTASYNVNYGTAKWRAADKNRGRKHTKEARQNMSQAQLNLPQEVKDEKAKRLSVAHKGKPHSAEWNSAVSRSKMKKIAQKDKNGNTIAIYSSLGEAAQKVELAASTISAAANNRRKSAGGFSWEYIKGGESNGR